MTARIDFDIDDQALKRAIAKAAGIADDLSPAMEAIGGRWKARTQMGFRLSRSPYGDRWAEVERDGKPLVDTRDLLGSIDYEANHDGLRLFAGTKYAARQHFGDPGTAGITARPFLPITQSGEAELPDAWASDAEQVITDLIERATNG